MRLAVLSDVHGNAAALDAVLADARLAGCGEHLVLGDLVDLGPSPREVVERIRQLNCPVVRGNHDPLDEVSSLPHLEAARRWTLEALDESTRAWLGALPLEHELALDGVRIWGVHGTPESTTRSTLVSTSDAEIETWAGLREFDVLCSGHTHLQLLRRWRGRTIVNVGSVGMPFVAPIDRGPPTILPWAEYAILDSVAGRIEVSLRQVPYAFEQLERAFRTSGFPSPGEFLDAWRR